MNASPTLGPLRDPFLEVLELVSLLTFVEDVDTTTDCAKLELSAKFELGPLVPCSVPSLLG